MIRRGDAVVVVVAALIVVTASCAVQRPLGYTRGMDAGDRARIAGRDLEAAHAYERAAETTGRPLDHDEAIYRAAQAYRHAGDVETALVRFDWLAVHGDARSRAPRARFEAASVRMDRGETDLAEASIATLIRRFPGSGPATRGMQRVLIARDERDPTGAAALAWLDSMATVVQAPEAVSALQYERARRLERLGRDDEALHAYATVLALPYAGNLHLDDGGLACARLLLARGRAREALRVADRVLDAREGVAMVPGSYERPHFPELAMLRGRILLDGLHDARAAADAYHAVYASFRTSLLRDDALEAEAGARETAGEHAGACDTWTTLAREFPCTRRGREARARVTACGRTVPGATTCPDARR